MSSLRLPFLRRLLLGLLILWCAFTVIRLDVTLTQLPTDKTRHFPFGVFVFPNGSIVVQDFAYNMLYFKGIHDRAMPHPYHLADQEQFMRTLIPGSASGISHAYSPVAFVLVQPFIHLSTYHAYVIYTILGALSIVLLFYFYLLPRAMHPGQIGALAICVTSSCLVDAFTIGQTVLITTPVLGLFWWLLQRWSDRPRERTLTGDFLIALLFWILCLKPSVAIIPLGLLLGAGAWRALAIGFGLLGVTWLAVCGYYGGWLTGLLDYQYLLNHYYNAELTPYMQRGRMTESERVLSTFIFDFDRAFIVISTLVLMALRWRGWITPSGHFQAVVWTFLLFSPYLLPSEHWVLCLLVVEGPFYRTGGSPAIMLKIALLAVILDSCYRTTSTQSFELKSLLVAWIVIDWIRSRRTVPPKGADDLPPLAQTSG